MATRPGLAMLRSPRVRFEEQGHMSTNALGAVLVHSMTDRSSST